MTMRGKGVVAIWNGVAGGADAGFIEWHVKEHMPERVGLPGFISGRRYAAVDGVPAYFNFYEVESPATLRSDAYLARLNDPTPWTRRVVATFVDVSRTLCAIAAGSGRGVGAFAEVLRFADTPDRDAAARLVSSLARHEGICAAHLFLRDEGPAQVTAETKLRKAPDTTWAAIVVSEMATADAARAARSGPLGDAALAAAGLAAPAERGLWRLDYLLRHEDVAGAGTDNAGKREISGQ